MTNKGDYPKKVISFDEQIKRLKERGLHIGNESEAKEYLRNISYFRLQGFWWDLQQDKKNHSFKEGVCFEQIISLYTFDRKLRLLLFDALERIEIAIRTKMAYYPSVEIDQWWFEVESNFKNKAHFSESLKEIDKELLRTKEVFIKSHYNKYGNEHRPPAYKTLEVVSFGRLSKLYSNLKNNIPAKNRVAKELGLYNYTYLQSWFLAFTTIRNIIAHHSRLWNRNIHFRPKYLSNPEMPFIEKPENENSLYYCMSCILYILNKVSKGHSIKEKLITLIEENQSISKSEMGIPENWREQPIWK
ncbi:MAG: abortive infection bacteriophage resistance protein [Luteibaculaceae bacterium]|jgi:abortive infection bacteriophage resistance protein